MADPLKPRNTEVNKSNPKDLHPTSGRDTGTGSSSIIKRNIHGTRPFTGDVKKHG